MGGIYRVVDHKGRCYIGSAKSLTKRRGEHWNALLAGRHHSRFLQSVWNKYGESHVRFEVLEEVADSRELLSREQYWLDTMRPVFNGSPTAANTLGSKRTPEQRVKMGLAHRGHPSHRAPKSAEHRAKISSSNKGKPSHLRGKSLSEETRRKMSISAKARCQRARDARATSAV